MFCFPVSCILYTSAIQKREESKMEYITDEKILSKQLLQKHRIYRISHYADKLDEVFCIRNLEN